MQDAALLEELSSTAESLFERHLATTKEWFPHELVPWSRGRDFASGDSWSPAETAVAGPVASALFVNLLTEDNLPYYFRTLERTFGADGVWGAWGRRWTAEEGRHSIVIRDYLTVTRSIDPVTLEQARMAQVGGGVTPELPDAAQTLVYVALQELATRIAHRNTGKLLDDRAGYDVMARVASDENLHHLFYRDLVKAAIEVDPSGMVVAIEQQVREFAMPGVGIPGFADHAAAIASAGIYDPVLHHEQILVPVVVRYWNICDIGGLDSRAEQARQALMDRIGRIGRIARRLADRRQTSSTPA